MATLKHYPSGFLGSSEVPQSKLELKQDTKKTFLTDIYRVVNTSTVQAYSSSVDVDYAYEMFMSKQTDNFIVKEDLLKISKKIFGTNTFAEWIELNQKNDEFSFLHMEFVDDLIRFVLLNESKKISNIFTWTNILFSKKQTNKIVNISDIQKNFLKNPNFYRMKIDDFILHWLAKENGISDLVISLTVMFGSRVKN